MNPTELQEALGNFIGTAGYTRYSPMFPNILLTDGTAFLAREAGAFWLMDMIASHLPSVPKDESFVLAVLDVSTTKAAYFTLQDDDPVNRFYAKQAIDYTTFPLDEIKLYVIREGAGWVILLPSEY